MRIAVRLVSGPVPSVATANDLAFRGDLFRVEPADCVLSPGLDKSLLVSAVPSEAGLESVRLRAFVRAVGTLSTLADGELYSCRVAILPGTAPGTYPLEIDGAAAFDAAGTPYPNVRTTNGSIVVSLVKPCPADCNYDGAVTIDELLRAVNASLGVDAGCSAADADADGAVTVEDLVTAVNAALTGCPADP